MIAYLQNNVEKVSLFWHVNNLPAAPMDVGDTLVIVGVLDESYVNWFGDVCVWPSKVTTTSTAPAACKINIHQCNDKDTVVLSYKVETLLMIINSETVKDLVLFTLWCKLMIHVIF